MNTAGVDICYRPLRIAWAIHSDDRDAYRYAVRVSHALRGGRFNPIVMVDSKEAADLVELYRADIIVPVGSSPVVAGFPARFPNLMKPLHPDMLFLSSGQEPSRAHLLDMTNALLHWRDAGSWRELQAREIRTFEWEKDDPLADMFLAQLGSYPTVEEVGIDYRALLDDATQAKPIVRISLKKDQPIPNETLEYPSIAYLSRFEMRRHYSVEAGWNHSGIFVGDATRIADLVAFWNLRAADISVQFFDPARLERFQSVRPRFLQLLKEELSGRDGPHGDIAIWARRDRLDEAIKLFAGEKIMACGFDEHSWKGGAVRPPLMILGEETSLGIVTEVQGQPQLSFAFAGKPFSGDSWFHTQHLVASLSILGGSDRNAQYTFNPPYIPELNRFFGQTMHVDRLKIRAEPDRVGLIIKATDHNSFLRALPFETLTERLFELVGVRSEPKGAGLITRQLIARLGGVDGARAFKIPGVRRLIKTFGIRDSFTKKAAIQLIGSKDPDNLSAKFADHEALYIEARPMGTKLTPPMVFAHLVAKGLFRIGSELSCPSCKLASWTALDQVQQRHTCELCGASFDATRQLVEGEFRYRRSGVLGLEKNTQGAIPVALLLQQLSVNFHGGMFLPSLHLRPSDGVDLPECETDFFILMPRHYPNRIQIVLGECKDRGGRIDSKDVANMDRIARSFPKHRFETFILFAKLSAFSPDEVSLAKGLNTKYENRVMLLTDRELEPYFLYERAKKELGIESHGVTPKEIAKVTRDMYFEGGDLAQP